ncbi:MAG: hypothetical protein HFH97_14135 [Lachnospiraceae bacterium]|nr:hypothetical protein [Lachnospiraceae bacterium]
MVEYQRFIDATAKNKTVIFGAGNMGKAAYYFCSKLEIEPAFFFDNDLSKSGKYLFGKRIVLPKEEYLKSIDCVYVIASQYGNEIKQQLISMNVQMNRIFSYEELLKEVGFSTEKKEQVVYYPIFDDSEELTSHYYRACWYLPRQNNRLKGVYLFSDKCELLPKPEYMGSSNVSVDHVIVTDTISDYDRLLKEARVILVWKSISDVERGELELSGAKVVNIITEDDEAKEYGRYCGLIWQYFKTQEEREEILKKSYEKFCIISNQIKRKKLHIGCIFGTGPSLESSYEFDFSNCLCVVCNSIVQDKNMLKHISPVFVTAGDVVSHLGVSLYAEKFRSDLVEYLQNSEAFFLTTAAFGYIMLEQCPEIAYKTILVEQLLDKQNYDLLECFALPKLDSTLNIHMLPIVNTFCDRIYMNGCDGKSPDIDNEDFWAHSRKAQYTELVGTGHKCHPTFDRNRQKKTYCRYQDSTTVSIEVGEKQYGKEYYILKQSYISALEKKKIIIGKDSKRNAQGQLLLSEL